jgi:putative DNA primase/helicase
MHLQKQSPPELGGMGGSTQGTNTRSQCPNPSPLSTAPTLLEAALELAGRGTPVFPCRSKDQGQRKAKEPLIAGGFKNATTDPEQIREWWSKWPDAFIGMPTGEASGFWVLDIDVKREDGLATLAQLEAEHGKLPDTLTATTMNGGQHRYFRMSPGTTIQSRAGIAPGIDVRGNGGYVIVPPSPGYQWWDSETPIAGGEI